MTSAVGALTGIIPVAVAGHVALSLTERALGKRRREQREARRKPQISKAERLDIVRAAFRLRLTTAAARDFTKNTGRKLPTLAEAKRVMARARRLQNPQRMTGGGLKRRRGL